MLGEWGWSVNGAPITSDEDLHTAATHKNNAWNYTRVERIRRCKIVDCMCMTCMLCINTCTLESHQ
ncbi:hypothetical protein HanXRQr2_Chr15g0711951 [Helianthus annuus]|uniref:Uncharacterized protein n=1 Tax=Helianthus annuus TaxID=4232 RepID=A0A9K3H3K4_HELAN|nr:hypothetical protein HanXRQr2_Chr15g0711951 [Helianthus annuus]